SAESDMAPNDSPVGINIKRRLRQREDLHQKFVDEAVIRVQEENPAHRHRQQRQEKTEPKRDFDKPLQRNVSSSDDPGEKDRQNSGDDYPDEREVKRVADRNR